LLKDVDLTGENRCATLSSAVELGIVASSAKIAPELLVGSSRGYLIYLGGKSQAPR